MNAEEVVLDDEGGGETADQCPVEDSDKRIPDADAFGAIAWVIAGATMVSVVICSLS
jgi:hypothetical protein